MDRAGAPGLLSPLRHRAFRLLWTGMSASLLGDGVLLVALAWQVYTRWGMPTAMSAVGVALSAPQVATLLAGGVASDRYDRRLIMLASDLVRAGCLTAVAVLTVVGALRLWELLVLVGAYGAAAGFFGPSFDAFVPTLLPEEDLVAANALDQFVRPASASILGPALGGILVGFAGAGWAFGLDAGTFLVSALCLARIGPSAPPPASTVDDAVPAGVWREMLEGLRYVRGNAWLWATFLAATFTYLLVIGPTEVLLPYLVRTTLHGSAGQLGLVLASGGLGAVLAALVVGHVGVPRAYMTFIYLAWACATLGVVAYGVATGVWQLAVACALINGLEAAGTIAWATAKQRLVPSAMLGRVSSVDWFVSIALVPLSYALAAPAARVLGVRTTLVGAGLLGAFVTFTFLYLPGVRAPQRRPVAA